MKPKNNQLSGSSFCIATGYQKATDNRLRRSLTFSVVTYIALAQTLAVMASGYIAPAQISPLHLVFEYNQRNNPGLLQQTAEIGATLLTEIPAMTVKLEQPVAKSNPLFLTLQNEFSLSDSKLDNKLSLPQGKPQQPLEKNVVAIKYVAINTEFYDYPQNTKRVKEEPVAVVVDVKVDQAEPGASQSIVHGSSDLAATETPQVQASTDAQGSTDAQHKKEPQLTQQPQPLPDGEALLSSKSFVSTIDLTSASRYPFEFYELAPEPAVPQQPELALQSSPEAKPSQGVYEKNLPGLLAYDITHPLVVAIDAGHGGVDPGTIGVNGLLEKDLTLDMAKRLQTLAHLHSDIEIVLNRHDSDGMSRAERVESVENVKADLLISLHFNSIPQGDITLVETYYTDTSKPPIYLNTAMAKAASETRSNKPGRSKGVKSTDTTNTSRKLARHLQAGVFRAVQNRNPLAIDAGVKEEKLFLLAQSGIPGVLVELTCLSNQQEENRLRTEQYRNELAHAVMTSLRKFVDSETLASSI